MKYKARFLGHDLCVGQDLEGGWHCWIAGSHPLTHDATFATADEAKRFSRAQANGERFRARVVDGAIEIRGLGGGGTPMRWSLSR